MKFRFVIILFSILLLSSGCQTIKNKSDEVAEKENERFGQFVGKQVTELRLELGAPTEDFINELGNEILQIKGTGAAVSHSIKNDIIKPNGESLTDEPFYMVATSDGSFSLTWQVPTDIESGDYTINATDGTNEASTTMKIL